jgi:FkbM family methyltransferase
MKRILRSLLVHAPAFGEAKAGAKSAVLKALRRPFEPEFRVLSSLAAASGECALDIGANRGQSIDAIRLFQPNLPILAFEPDARLAASLQARFAADASITIHGHGLGARRATLPLFTPAYAGYVFDGLASTDRAEAEGWLNARTLIGFDAAKLTLREQTIDIRPLDDLHLAPAFVKIDVQGAEEAVIAGGAETIRAHRPAMLIETGLNEGLVKMVEATGYRPFNFENGRLVPRQRAVRNTVFVHPEAPRGLSSLIAS